LATLSGHACDCGCVLSIALYIRWVKPLSVLGQVVNHVLQYGILMCFKEDLVDSCLELTAFFCFRVARVEVVIMYGLYFEDSLPDEHDDLAL